MMLRDEIDILDSTGTLVETVPAEVHYASTTREFEDGTFRMEEKLRAIIEPWPYDHRVHLVRWRDVVYDNDGPPMVRRFHGVDHHVTIPLIEPTA